MGRRYFRTIAAMSRTELRRRAQYLDRRPLQGAARRWLRACAALLWLVAAPWPLWAAPPIPRPHVLVLEDESAERPVYLAFMQGLREGLAPLREAVVYAENLDLARFPTPAHLERQGRWLATKYGEVRIDIVVAAGRRALDYALAGRPALFPQAAILFLADGVASPPEGNATGIGIGLDTQAMLRDALALLPGTRRVVLVTDLIDTMNYWRTLREDLQRLPSGIELVVLEALPIDDLRRSVAQLPADSLVLYTRQLRDRDGRDYAQTEVLDALAAAANAPLFGQVGWQLGHGVVGGRLVDAAELGRHIAALVRRVAAGEAAGTIPVGPAPHFAARYDGRQIERWRIDRALLPPDAQLLYASPSLWEEHRALVIGVGAALLLQTALIGALLWEHRARRRAEAGLRRRTQQIAQLNRSAALGEVSAAIAHEVNQPLGSILLNAETAERLLGGGAAAQAEAREVLADIRRDGRRAAAVVDKVRQLFRRSEVDAQPVALNAVARAAAEIVRADARFGQLAFELDLAPGLPAVPGDPVQLQQVVLNLATNAAEALLGAPGDGGRIAIATRRAASGDAVELEVSDSGPGLEPGTEEAVFEPFHSGKSDGMGMGLAISRGIAAAHGGTLVAENRAGGGACFRLTLPAVRA